jgi:hypothetical protein
VPVCCCKLCCRALQCVCRHCIASSVGSAHIVCQKNILPLDLLLPLPCIVLFTVRLQLCLQLCLHACNSLECSLILCAALHCACYVRSASAASRASALLGPELLSHIRLPAWAELMPAPTPAAAAASLAQQPSDSSSSSCLWWHDGSSSSSRIHTNQQWLQELQQATCKAGPKSESTLRECDCCGSLLQLSSKQQQQPSVSAYYSCAGCGMALYCSSSCRAADSRSHSRHCRLLQAVAQPGGDSRDWTELTAAAAAAGGGSSLVLRHA